VPNVNDLNNAAAVRNTIINLEMVFTDDFSENTNDVCFVQLRVDIA